MNYEAIGGRRWLFALLIFATATVLLWFGKLDAAAWVNLLQWTFGAFAFANVVQRAVEAKADQAQK